MNMHGEVCIFHQSAKLVINLYICLASVRCPILNNFSISAQKIGCKYAIGKLASFQKNALCMVLLQCRLTHSVLTLFLCMLLSL